MQVDTNVHGYRNVIFQINSCGIFPYYVSKYRMHTARTQNRQLLDLMVFHLVKPSSGLGHLPPRTSVPHTSLH